MITVTKRRARGLGAALIWLASGALHAQNAPQADELDLLAQENLVYSAARYAQTIAETPANVSVISRDDIRRYGYRSVQDALKSLPGVYDATSQWPALGVSGVAVPGDFGSRVLYLINGMPIYEPTYGGFFLEYLDIESIERIEFVKGAGSALYGSGAVLGLVNLITRGAKDAPGNSAAVSVASHDSAKVYFSSNGQAAGVSSFVAASAAYSGGRDIYLPEMDRPGFNQSRFHGLSSGNDAARTTRLFARLSRGPAWLQAMLIDGAKRDPLASYGSIFNARLMLRESQAAVETGFTRELGEGGLLTARAFGFATAERGEYPYAHTRRRGVPASYINVSDLASRQLGAELRYDRFVAPGHHVLAGVELKHIGFTHQVGDQPGLARAGEFSVNNNDSYMQWALFAQDEMRLGPGKLFLGARFDSYHGFSDGVSSRLSPRIAYVQEIAPRVTAKLMYGQAYRAPTIYESRYQDGAPQASTIWANGALRPELSRSLEALLIGQAPGGVEWRLSAFLKDLEGTPVQVAMPVSDGVPCALGPDACIQYRNAVRHQEVIGGEFDLRMRQGDHGDLYASLVLQRGRGEGGALASSPRHQLKAGISRELPWQGANAALEAQYIGAMQGRIDDDISARDSLPSYLVLGAVVNAAHLGDGWRASLRVDNLLDRRYGTVASRELQPLKRVPADGRRFALQLQRDF
ncbi:MAG: TonB-dependent receptor [Pseudomonadota bacterium]